tara:strand:+ start:71 stop:262 length:192 start_codon:yes stop_codon:yes gene_type:complete
VDHLYNKQSQLQTQIAVLESQIEVKNTKIELLQAEIKRLEEFQKSILVSKDKKKTACGQGYQA